MAIKNYTVRNFNGTDWDTLYPKTSSDQVIESTEKQFISSSEKASIKDKLNASSYTATDILTKLKTVDGAGSGLDADTLDGLQATEFLQPTSPLDATKLTGIIPISSIPPAALERLHVVANQIARFALTTATVQVGDTVKETDTGKMFYVKDDTKLNTAAGYEEYTVGSAASVPWNGITDKPTTVAESGLSDAATKTLASNSVDGLMSKDDKEKLDALPVATNIPAFTVSATTPVSSKTGDFWFQTM